MAHCEPTGGSLLLTEWHGANRRVGACHSSSGTMRSTSCDIARFVQRAPWIKSAATGRTFFQFRIFIIRKSFSAHTAHHGCFFIRACRSKRMIFKFIVAFVAGIKFPAHRAFICDYVELRMIMNAPALLVRQFSIDFFRKDFHVNHLIKFQVDNPYRNSYYVNQHHKTEVYN